MLSYVHVSNSAVIEAIKGCKEFSSACHLGARQDMGARYITDLIGSYN